MEIILNNIYKVALNRNKEHFETILEPLQSVLQLALVSFQPIGTKLYLQQNTLQFQTNTWHQSFVRFYNNDQKEDLYFLFNAITRFYTFYEHVYKSEDPILTKLFQMLVDFARNGIDRIILTYQQSNDNNLINMLQLYKVILRNPGKYVRPEDVHDSNIDQILIQINQIYTVPELHLLYNALCIIDQSEPEDRPDLVRGLNRWMQPKCRTIKKWISEHIVY